MTTEDASFDAPTMIFHVPFSLDPNAKSASGIRPVKMRQAFADAGYRVLEVSGTHEQRKKQIKVLKKEIANGLRPDFVYSEAKTTPTGLGEPVTRHTSLTRDIRFLRYCRDRGIPTSLFYRDVYWRFPRFKSYAREPWRSFLIARYHADLRAYEKALSVLYVPSMDLVEHLPRQHALPAIRELPPGLDIVGGGAEHSWLRNGEEASGVPRILYVGGVGPEYRIDDAVRAANEASNGSLVVCTREADWAQSEWASSELNVGVDQELPRVRLVHASGEGLEALYEWAQVGSLFVAPDPYRRFAVPFKLYEYLGHGKPVVASAGTYAGDIVQKHGLGWVVRDSKVDFLNWIEMVGANPSLLDGPTRRVREYREEHTWLQRARQVGEDLTGPPGQALDPTAPRDGQGRRKPPVLILSLSNIARDVRVLKQIRLLVDAYQVTTCGYGTAPDGVASHIEVSATEPRIAAWLRALFVRLHWYWVAYWMNPEIRRARRALRKRGFDAVLANDLDAAPLALAVAPAERIHMDIHEYWPGLYDQDPAWVKLRRPYYGWMLRRYVSRAASLTVVNDAIAQRYEREFGLASSVVPNASPYRDLRPSEVGSPIRAVYAGGANPLRRIDNLMRAAAAVEGVTLDLYLVGEGTEHYRRLQELAAELGESVQVVSPVRPDKLVDKLNEYDIGFHSLPPTNTNHALALPNKFYEYIQARLALVLGPSNAMVQEASGFRGAIFAEDFSVGALAKALGGLSSTEVAKMKRSSDRAAGSFSAEQFDHLWEEPIAARAHASDRDPGRSRGESLSTRLKRMLLGLGRRQIRQVRHKSRDESMSRKRKLEGNQSGEAG